MNKKAIVKMVLAFTLLAVVVLWILNLAGVEAFAGFNGYWAVLLVAGVAGAALVVSAFTSKQTTVQKKPKIFIGVGLLLIAALSLIMGIIDVDMYTWLWPVIALAAALAIFLCVTVAGGKKWDTGDNQVTGYKNYHERKKEQQEQEAKARLKEQIDEDLLNRK